MAEALFHVKHPDDQDVLEPQKHSFSDAELRFLEQGLPAEMVGDFQAGATLLSDHLEELTIWAPRLNLVAQGTRAEWLRRHFLDSLRAAGPIREICGSNIACLMDIGSGAGFPGLPLAAVLGPRKTVLVEPRRRRAHFLRAVLRRGEGEGIAVENTRLANLSADTPADVIVSRATFADPTEILTGCLPLLQAGGLVVLFCAASAPKPPASAVPPEYQGLDGVGYSLPESTRPHELRLWRRR